MQTAAFAFVIFLGAGALAIAAGSARPVDAADAPVQPTDVSKDADDAPGPHEAADKAPAKPRVDTAHHPDTHGRVCFSPAETRDKIAQHRLTEPFRALRSGGISGEALRARLCHWKSDEYVYEISVLRRDGRIAHVYMNAQSGQIIGGPASADRK